MEEPAHDGADLAEVDDEDEGGEAIDTNEKLPKWVFKRMNGG